MSPRAKTRVTITLEKDVAAAIARHRLERKVGQSEAVNDLIRDGLIALKVRPAALDSRP